MAEIKMFGEYFEKKYVLGVISRERRRGILPLYLPKIWN